MRRLFTKEVSLILTSLVFAAACSSSGGGGGGKGGEEKPTSGPGSQPPGSGQTTPPTAPVQGPVTMTEKDPNNSAKTVLPLVEAIDLANGQVELRFFSTAPRDLCSVDSFYNTSSYETNFTYLRVKVSKAVGRTQLRVGIDAETGARGNSTIMNRSVSGEINLTSVSNENYVGWVDAETTKNRFKGAFSVVNCSQTAKILSEKFHLPENDTAIEMRFANGAKQTVYLQYDSQFYSQGTYQEYVTRRENTSIQISTRGESTPWLPKGASGHNAGLYISSGGQSCEGGIGAATLEIVGNTIYGGGGNGRPYFCPTAKKSFQITLNPSTGKRSLILNSERGQLTGEF